MPSDFGVYEMLEDNLKKMGFSQVSVLAPSFRYKFKDRFLNFLQKSLFKNRAYKKQLIDTYYNTEVCSSWRSARYYRCYRYSQLAFEVAWQHK